MWSDHFHCIGYAAVALRKGRQYAGNWNASLIGECVSLIRKENCVIEHKNIKHHIWQTCRRIMFLSKTIWKGKALQKVNGLILFSNDINWSKLIWSFSGSETEMLLTRSLISNWTWSQSSPLCLIMFTSTSCPCSLLATACNKAICRRTVRALWSSQLAEKRACKNS